MFICLTYKPHSLTVCFLDSAVFLPGFACIHAVQLPCYIGLSQHFFLGKFGPCPPSCGESMCRPFIFARVSDVFATTPSNLDASSIRINLCRAQQQQITRLHLSEAHTVPDAAWQSLSTHLTHLSLRFLQLTQLPKGIFELTKLRELDVRDNALSLIPPAVGGMPSLQLLWAANNSLVGEQLTCAQRDASARSSFPGTSLLGYLRLTADEAQKVPLRSLHVVALGHFKAGKTCLLNALKQEACYVPEAERTAEVTFSTSAFSQKDVTLDFAFRELPGQAEFMSTNAHFIPPSHAVFVVVFSLGASESAIRSQLHTWLHMLEVMMHRHAALPAGDDAAARLVVTSPTSESFSFVSASSSPPAAVSVQRTYSSSSVSLLSSYRVLLVGTRRDAASKEHIDDVSYLCSDMHDRYSNVEPQPIFVELGSKEEAKKMDKPVYKIVGPMLHKLGIDVTSGEANKVLKFTRDLHVLMPQWRSQAHWMHRQQAFDYLASHLSDAHHVRFALDYLERVGEVLCLGDHIIVDPRWLSVVISTIVAPARSSDGTTFRGIAEGKVSEDRLCVENGVARALVLKDRLKGYKYRPTAADAAVSLVTGGSSEDLNERAQQAEAAACQVLCFLEAIDVIARLRGPKQSTSVTAPGEEQSERKYDERELNSESMSEQTTQRDYVQPAQMQVQRETLTGQGVQHAPMHDPGLSDDAWWLVPARIHRIDLPPDETQLPAYVSQAYIFAVRYECGVWPQSLAPVAREYRFLPGLMSRLICWLQQFQLHAECKQLPFHLEHLSCTQFRMVMHETAQPLSVTTATLTVHDNQRWLDVMFVTRSAGTTADYACQAAAGLHERKAALLSAVERIVRDHCYERVEYTKHLLCPHCLADVLQEPAKLTNARRADACNKHRHMLADEEKQLDGLKIDVRPSDAMTAESTLCDMRSWSHMRVLADVQQYQPVLARVLQGHRSLTGKRVLELAEGGPDECRSELLKLGLGTFLLSLVCEWVETCLERHHLWLATLSMADRQVLSPEPVVMKLVPSQARMLKQTRDTVLETNVTVHRTEGKLDDIRLFLHHTMQDCLRELKQKRTPQWLILTPIKPHGAWERVKHFNPLEDRFWVTFLCQYEMMRYAEARDADTATIKSTPCSYRGKSYEIKLGTKFATHHLPWIRKGLGYLLLVLQVLPVVGSVAHKLFHSNARAKRTGGMNDLAEQVQSVEDTLGKLEDMYPNPFDEAKSSSGDAFGSGSDSVKRRSFDARALQLTDAEAESLSSVLVEKRSRNEKLDDSHSYSGLRLVTSCAGYNGWCCPEHYEVVRAELP